MLRGIILGFPTATPDGKYSFLFVAGRIDPDEHCFGKEVDKENRRFPG